MSYSDSRVRKNERTSEEVNELAQSCGSGERHGKVEIRLQRNYLEAMVVKGVEKEMR